MKYVDYVNTGKLRTDIGLEEFLKLFINHKPSKGEEITELRKVFKIVGQSHEDPGNIPPISREAFINFLKTRGEAFKEKDFNSYIKPLFEEKTSSESTVSADGENKDNYNIEETDISYEWFIKEILKIKDNFIPSNEADKNSDYKNIQIVLDDQEPVIKA